MINLLSTVLRYNEMGDVFVVYLFLDALVMVLNPKDVQVK